jgi:hypothetical protein
MIDIWTLEMIDICDTDINLNITWMPMDGPCIWPDGEQLDRPDPQGYIAVDLVVPGQGL